MLYLESHLVESYFEIIHKEISKLYILLLNIFTFLTRSSSQKLSEFLGVYMDQGDNKRGNSRGGITLVYSKLSYERKRNELEDINLNWINWVLLPIMVSVVLSLCCSSHVYWAGMWYERIWEWMCWIWDHCSIKLLFTKRGKHWFLRAVMFKVCVPFEFMWLVVEDYSPVTHTGRIPLFKNKANTGKG